MNGWIIKKDLDSKRETFRLNNFQRACLYEKNVEFVGKISYLVRLLMKLGGWYNMLEKLYNLNSGKKRPSRRIYPRGYDSTSCSPHCLCIFQVTYDKWQWPFADAREILYYVVLLSFLSCLSVFLSCSFCSFLVSLPRPMTVIFSHFQNWKYFCDIERFYRTCIYEKYHGNVIDE